MKVNETINQTKIGILIFGLILFFMVISGFFQINTLKRTIKFYEKEQSKLQKKIDSLENNYKIQENNIVNYQNKIIDLDSKISDNNKKIKDLYENANRKKNSFKHYDARMWERYFTDRYSKKN